MNSHFLWNSDEIILKWDQKIREKYRAFSVFQIFLYQIWRRKYFAFTKETPWSETEALFDFKLLDLERKKVGELPPPPLAVSIFF